jgi:hypothetical protein
MVTVAYTQSLLRAVRQLQGAVDLVPLFIGTALISQARNAFATRVLENPSITHLLFIDADVGFGPEAIRRMIDFDHDVVGCFYPRREFDLDRLHGISRQVDNPKTAWMIAQDYVTGALIRDDLGNGQTGYVVTNGFVQARQIGMGLTLIKRSVLERMRDAYPELLAPATRRYRELGVREQVLQAFESMPNEDGVYVSEDLSFCERWRRIGGEIWVCVDEVITHVGRMAFEGRYLDRLAFESAAKP